VEREQEGDNSMKIFNRFKMDKKTIITIILLVIGLGIGLAVDRGN